MENTFSVYQVRTYNFGSREHGMDLSYSSLDKAKQRLFEYCEMKNTQNEFVDLDGRCETFPGYENIDNWVSRNKPSIYYFSKYGNYKCVVYVQEVFIY
jgi:hypothetical protein